MFLAILYTFTFSLLLYVDFDVCAVYVFASAHLKVSRAAVLEEVKQNAAGQFTLHNMPVRSTTGLNKHKMHTGTSGYLRCVYGGGELRTTCNGLYTVYTASCTLSCPVRPYYYSCKSKT